MAGFTQFRRKIIRHIKYQNSIVSILCRGTACAAQCMVIMETFAMSFSKSLVRHHLWCQDFDFAMSG